jgi:hypothetical protein
MMEMFAAYGMHWDYHMDRIIEAVKKMPDVDTTPSSPRSPATAVLVLRVVIEGSVKKSCSSMASLSTARTI